MDNNGFEYIDLRLPSGTLWATCNVCAEKPTDIGLYFQWGDVIGYSINDALNNVRGYGDYDESWKGYRFGPIYSMTKYNTVDKKTVLDLEDDAAHVYMGGDWRMPTRDEWEELLDNTMQSHAEGIITLTHKLYTDKFIQFPLSSSQVWSVDFTYLWASTLARSERDINNAHYVCLFGETLRTTGHTNRHYGFQVRGVIRQGVL